MAELWKRGQKRHAATAKGERVDQDEAPKGAVLSQKKFQDDPEGLEAFIAVALREMDQNADDVITVEELESWFETLEEEVEEGSSRSTAKEDAS